MTDAAAPVPVHPRQGRMFSTPAQLAAEGAADAFRASVDVEAAALREAGADALSLALVGAVAAAVELELRAPRPRPSAILGGVKLLREVLADAAGAPTDDGTRGGGDDDEWLAGIADAAAVRDTAHP